MFNDKTLTDLEKKLHDSMIKERGMNNQLRILQDDYRRVIEREEKDFKYKEERVRTELERLVREITNLEKDVKKRREEVQREFENSVKKA